MEELVVLVDEKNNVVGTAPKATVHTTHTPLHRGFSVFLFNDKHEVLVTQRALSKKTFAGVWSNSFCGHPAPDERVEEAAKRRAKLELGISTMKVHMTLQYRYCHADAHGIVENEVCPIMIATTSDHPKPNPDEIEGMHWVPWSEFFTDIQLHPDKYSPWSNEETLLVAKQVQVLWGI
jgi:isopentenyl-diphosphate Delta-isomerase